MTAGGLAFIDESGDPGLSIGRGASRFFTLAAAFFATPEDAYATQVSIEELRQRLHMAPTAEFHFRSDGHHRRLEFLMVVSKARCQLSAVTIDKMWLPEGEPSNGPSIQRLAAGRLARDSAALFEEGKVIIDGLGDREMRRELREQLSHVTRVRSVSFRRSHSDPLLQVADYCAGVVNRSLLQKDGAGEYEGLVAKKFISRTTLRGEG